MITSKGDNNSGSYKSLSQNGFSFSFGSGAHL
jgi:hypothetical protein